MSKEQKQAYVLRRAKELAATGKHLDYLTIENAIIKEGYPEVRDWLDRPGIRADLKAICDRARKAADA